VSAGIFAASLQPAEHLDIVIILTAQCQLLYFKAVTVAYKYSRLIINALQGAFLNCHRYLKFCRMDISFNMHARAPVTVVIVNKSAGTGNMAFGHLCGDITDSAVGYFGLMQAENTNRH